MKKFITLVLLIASTSSFSSESNIYDLQYLPKSGTVFGATDFILTRFSDRYFNGTDYFSSRTRGHFFQQALGYSLADNLFVSATFSYGESEYKVTGEPVTNSTGFTDHSLDARLRLLDSDYRFDVLTGVGISLENSRIEKDGDGNNYSGGHSIYIGGEYGYKTGAHQWSLWGKLTHKFKQTLDDKESDEKVKSDAHNMLELGANLLTRLSENLHIRNGLMAQYREEYKDEFDMVNTGSSVYTVTSQFLYTVTQNFMVKAGANVLLGGNGDNFSFMIYNVGANYQF